jgi:HEAT repeat protein
MKRASNALFIFSTFLIGCGPSLEELEIGLSDEDWVVRRSAAWGLRKIDSDRSTTLLIKALEDEHHAVRAIATGALRKNRDKRAISALARSLKDNNVCVRAAAAFALSTTKDSSAVPHLIEALHDETIREEVTDALQVITNRKFDSHEEWAEWYRSEQLPKKIKK